MEISRHQAALLKRCKTIEEGQAALRYRADIQTTVYQMLRVRLCGDSQEDFIARWGTLSPKKRQSVHINERRFSRLTQCRHWQEFFDMAEIGVRVVGSCAPWSLRQVVNQFAEYQALMDEFDVVRPRDSWVIDVWTRFQANQPDERK